MTAGRPVIWMTASAPRVLDKRAEGCDVSQNPALKHAWRLVNYEA